METEGVDVTPIRQANGDAKFCEVVLTDVFVPDAMIVGQPGDGWSLAVGAMAVERTAIGGYVSIDRTAALRHVAAFDGPDRDAVVRSPTRSIPTQVHSRPSSPERRFGSSRVASRARRPVSPRSPCPACSVGPPPLCWPYRAVGVNRGFGPRSVRALLPPTVRTDRRGNGRGSADGHRPDDPRPATEVISDPHTCLAAIGEIDSSGPWTSLPKSRSTSSTTISEPERRCGSNRRNTPER